MEKGHADNVAASCNRIVSERTLVIVIPAKAGIQASTIILASKKPGFPLSRE
jgi:hypothetical protein